MKMKWSWGVASGLLAAAFAVQAENDASRAVSTVANIAAQEVKGSNDKIPDWLKRTDISIEGLENSKPTWSIETVQPLFQTPSTLDHTLFFQGRWGHRAGDDTLNLGAGYRHLLENKSWLLGVNVFHDMERKANHRRWGFGAEAIGRYATVRANYYKPDSGTKIVRVSDGVTETEKALRGHDVEVDVPVPYLPWMRFSASSYRWYAATSGLDDQKGDKYTLLGNISKHLSFELSQLDDNYRRKENSFKLTYTFGKPSNGVDNTLFDGLKASRAFTERDLTKHTLDKVVRQHEIIVEKRRSGGGGVSIGRRN